MRERLVTEMTQRRGPLIVSSETAVTLLGGRCCANEMPPGEDPYVANCLRAPLMTRQTSSPQVRFTVEGKNRLDAKEGARLPATDL
jgi:hypothetical protein